MAIMFILFSIVVGHCFCYYCFALSLFTFCTTSETEKGVFSKLVLYFRYVFRNNKIRMCDIHNGFQMCSDTRTKHKIQLSSQRKTKIGHETAEEETIDPNAENLWWQIWCVCVWMRARPEAIAILFAGQRIKQNRTETKKIFFFGV